MIVIGKDGSLLKEAGEAARKEMEEILGTKVYLETHVKVKPGWQEDAEMLRQLSLL